MRRSVICLLLQRRLTMKPRTLRKVVPSLILCFAWGLYPAAVRADVVIDSSLSLTQLQIQPSAGSVQFLSPFNASTFTQVFDSSGGADQQFNTVNDGATSASASTTLVHATAAASALSMTASTTAGVNIPQITADAGTSPGSPYGLLQGFFEIVGATGPISVQLKASLDVHQSLSTSGGGQLATSEAIFNLLLPDISGDPILSFDNLLQIGQNDSIASSSSPTLSDFVMLPANTPLSLIFSTDTDVYTVSSVPEPSSFWLLLIVLGVGALSMKRRERLRCTNHARRD
jgi:hypothetical protein